MSNLFNNEKNNSNNELDVTAFLGLMIVLVPILLVSVKFTVLGDLLVNGANSGAGSENTINEQMVTKTASLELYENKVKLYVDGKQSSILNWSELSGFNFGAIGKSNKDISMMIKVHDEVEYQKVVNVLDLINKYTNHFKSISVDYNG
ncbi:TPA: biopolymer transporter ExbD [Photobacterium damselae]